MDSRGKVRESAQHSGGVGGQAHQFECSLRLLWEPFRGSEDPADDMSLGAVHAINSGVHFAGQRRKAEQSAREHDARK